MRYLKLWLAYWCAKKQSIEIDNFFKACALISEHLNPFTDEKAFSFLALKLDACDFKSYLVWKEIIIEAEKQKICFTFPGETDFPPTLLELEEIPYFLNYLGYPIWMELNGLAIVGGREPKELTQEWCEQELKLVIQDNNLFYVSGGARGVDQIVHTLSLRLNRPTVAVLPSGLFSIYPESFSKLIPQIILAKGALLSEYLPRTKMQKHFFQQRNRLISGLSMGTLLLDARRRSGTMLTAREAIEQGRPLFVVPSHPFDTANQGALDLLFEGATPVRDAVDLNICLSSELLGKEKINTHIVV